MQYIFLLKEYSNQPKNIPCSQKCSQGNIPSGTSLITTVHIECLWVLPMRQWKNENAIVLTADVSASGNQPTV